MKQRRTPDAGTPTSPEDEADEAGTALAVVSDEGVVTGWSEGARALLGYPSEEIVGRPAGLLLDTVVGPETLSEIRHLQRWIGRIPLRHRDGHRTAAHVLAHHRTAGLTAPEWLLVSALPVGGVHPSDDTLALWTFEQSPQCSLAVYDTRLRMRRSNTYATDAAQLPEEGIRGLRISEILANPIGDSLEEAMIQVLETGEPQYREFGRQAIDLHARAWSTQLYPVRDGEGIVRGVGMASHDNTEQDRARRRLQLLNDANNRMGGTLDVAVAAQELAGVAVPELADFAAVDLLPDPDSARVATDGEAPAGTAPLPVRLRRTAHRSVLPGTPEAVVAVGEVDRHTAASATAECLATGRPVLRDAYDRLPADWLEGDTRREETVRAFGIHSVLAVPLQARGTTLGVALYARHRRPVPFAQEDVLLAQEITTRAALYIDNARRYTRERGTAAALQRTLLPQRLPHHAAVLAASRYLPAGALGGVGGDWFDLIPLSSARVALVVGDVVGHGVQAAATMGRLRTAVRTLADVDLPPDELLTHLDDLVIRLSAETDAEGTSSSPQTSAATGGFGATCLYAVYDPISRVCTLADAGHPVPALRTPAGTVDFLDVPAGPPLGLGGLPFEAVEFTLPEGSALTLYTDGLIESRTLDIDEGMARLREALAGPAASPDELCDAVLGMRPPPHRSDDVALLIAFTRALDSAHVTTWDLPAEPSVVARARRLVSARLTAWGLEDAAFVTELVASELVTNAIRYAAPPIQLRLILSEPPGEPEGNPMRRLICEVSDASSTAPHLRRARTYDEGGRGLLLVAQLTQAWGTRYTTAGKTIWAEQNIDETAD
ncbi:SpoIIE family protein phosphatase [Streptomyces sp. NPDC005820]|uniref:SpoIIE family protein phosphatase n=1 Tax=Streptomyces sp. NPDC005820 TaxID=3157069 RepID=UPI0033DE2A3D